MRAVIRVDASLQIGSGHVMRCISLAEKLREKGAAIKFVTRNFLGNLDDLISKNNLQGIVIPSMRTPKNIIELCKNKLSTNSLIIDNVDKKAYLSALSLAKYVAVTCDSTSMISEAALTGKPIYVADIPAKKNDQRIKKFKELFTKLNIIKKLDNKLETWHYETLDETNRIAKEIKKQLS